jgi:lipopolysaccharide export system permease protein
MKRLDRLVLNELVGPWLFGVAIFTTLIMAGTYLFRLTDYLVSGIGLSEVVQMTMLLLPGVMVKTFSMAVLLAALLAFGRLSSDSEIVALKATGASIGRIMLPVAAFSFVIAATAFAINETVVPWAAYRGTALQIQIEKTLHMRGEPIHRATYDGEGNLTAMLMAEDFNLQQRSLSGVWLVKYDREQQPELIMNAERMRFQTEADWRVEGRARIFDRDLKQVIEVEDMWPGNIPQPPTMEDMIASRLRDLDSFSMTQMRQRIAAAKLNPTFDPAQIANLEYGYFNKLALPLSAMIFALVGAPLGIRNHRTGAATGFWLSVIIIFAYMMLANFMALWAQGGVIPAWAASFTPLAIGIIAAVFLIQRRNV